MKAEDYCARIVRVLAVAMSLFHLYTAGTLPFPPSIQGSIHLGFALAIIFLTAMVGQKRGPATLVVDILLVIGSLVAIGRVFSFLGEIPPEVTAFLSISDQVLAAILVVAVLEASRRVAGAALSVCTLVFIAYAFLGDRLPGIFGHEGVSISRMLSVSYYSAQGIYGVPLGASADLIFPLVLFGAFMIVMGSTDVFFQLSVRLTARVRGGAALATVIASTAMGTVTGSGIANATSSGVFTIPLMKRAGYRPQMAAAIESAASSGSQILPPVLGTSAFIMAELLGISYGTIATAALVPGLLYFVALMVQVYLEACRTNIGKFSSEGIPSVRQVLREGWHLLLGPLLLLYLIIVADMSPGRAAFFSILMVVAVDVLSQLLSRRRVKLDRIIEGLVTGAVSGAGIAAATACVGLIIGALDITGVSIRLGALVEKLAGGNAMILLVLTMVFSLILGTGLPTLLAYIVVAVTVAPALINAGFDPLAAHLFVFYFAILADITPPVAVTAVVAARIAGASPMGTANTATRLVLIVWLIPYYFVFHPEILLRGSIVDIAMHIGMATIGTFLLTVGVQGYFRSSIGALRRIAILGCVGVFFVAPGSVLMNMVALGVATIIALLPGNRPRPAEPLAPQA